LQNFQKQFIKTLQDEEENEDPLAMEEDDSVLEGSVTESSLIEAPDSGETGEVKEEVKIIQVSMLFLFLFLFSFTFLCLLAFV
jgi:hypothetical protein